MFKIAIASSEQSMACELRKVLLNIPGYAVIWLAYDSDQVLEKCRQEEPDLLIMDVAIHQLRGVVTTEKVVKDFPCTILALTLNAKKDLSLIFDMMGKGAIDVINISTKDFSNPLEVEVVLKKIKMVAGYLGKEGHRNYKGIIAQKKLPPLLVIGASTGGPIAIAKVLSSFPKDCPLAVVVVQHIDEEFVGGFSRWLESQILMKVQLVHEGASPEAGKVLVAGKNLSLVMTPDQSLSYIPNMIHKVHCPSIDMFFESVAMNWSKPFSGLLLTGMGHDGANGLKQLRNSGWYTIVQSKETSVIFGMPKAAIEADAVSEILNLNDISGRILKLLAKVI